MAAKLINQLCGEIQPAACVSKGEEDIYRSSEYLCISDKPQQKQPGQPSVPIYLPELLVNVYSYGLMENSVSYYCVHGFSQIQSQYYVRRFSYILMYWLFTTVKLAICVTKFSASSFLPVILLGCASYVHM